MGPVISSISKKFLESLRRQGGIAHRILNVAVSEIRLDGTRVVAIVGELVTAGVAEHVWACALMPSSAAAAARSIMREKPGADSGAPRSETNTNGDGALSR
jgi:hypothetical protein